MFLLFFTFLAALDPNYYASTEIHAAPSFTSITSIEEISTTLKEADAETLIVFDVDEVLITTKDPFLRPEAEPIFLSHVKEAMSQAKSAEEQEAIEKKLSDCLVSCERYVLEPAAVKLIQELQNMHKKVIAITSHPTGKLGNLPSVERWKVDSIQSFGFHFEHSFPGFRATSPLYVDGVIFSRGSTKGDILVQFLDQLGCFKPKKVICIDDLIKNHETLRDSLAEYGISYTGFWYRKAALTPEQIDAKRIAWQFQELMKTGVWKEGL